MNSFFLLYDKTVKTLSIVNKFNTTINFLNLGNFLKEILFLWTNVVDKKVILILLLFIGQV
jgi:hypothetical protein